MRDEEAFVPTEMRGTLTKYLVASYYRYVWALDVLYKDHPDPLVVIDAACGRGYGTHILSTLSQTVYAVDRSAVHLDWARRNYQFLCPVAFREYDLEVGLPEGAWGAVVSFETLEHLHEPSRLVASAQKLSGPFVFSVPLEAPSRFHPQSFTRDDVAALVPGAELFPQREDGRIGMEPAAYLLGCWRP